MAPRGSSPLAAIAIAIAVAVAVAVAAGIVRATPVEARTLHWRSLEIDARLDADGALHVRERHAMVFSGAWNGGERTFDLRPGQDLALDSVVRFDPGTKTETPLRKGGLDQLDHYDWYDHDTLRWRSRLPTDPEFDDTEIVYEIEYSLTGILIGRGDFYRLDHDFAFPDRVGRIETFRLVLDLDPIWSAPLGFENRLERRALLPGESVVVTADLAYAGDGTPAAVPRFLPDSLRLIPLALALLVAAAMGWSFWRHESNQGRFLSADAPDDLDRGWLEDHVFALRPEVAGALWDGSVGSPEVSALIASWVQDGRVRSEVRKSGSFWKRDVLELELLVEREAFSGYERRLLDKLFFSGRTKTDTEAIRNHYRSTGFSPASTIRASIERRLRELPGMGRSVGAPDRTPGCMLLIVFIALLVFEFWSGGESALALAITLLGVGLLPAGAAHSLAYSYRRKGAGQLRAAPWIALPLVLLFLLLVAAILAPGRWQAFAQMRLGLFGSSAAALFFVLVAAGVFNSARTRESMARVARRKQLGRARELLARELEREDPDLEDRWLPYLLAFGLDRRVDRWFRAFGGANSRRFGASTTTSGSGRSGGSAWTGGGGAFGGAGATAAWTAAAGGIAAGVAKPSSGGGSSGGGGGGGSSGGGGGGGW